MAVSINYTTFVINIPQSFLTPLGGTKYELDVNALRLALKDLEDDPDGMAFTDTHVHNPPVVLAGVTYARQVVILNPYTVTFEDGQYTVIATGANHNLADVKNENQVSLVTQNSAGLVTVVSGSGVTEQDKQDIAALILQDPKFLSVGKFLGLK